MDKIVRTPQYRCWKSLKANEALVTLKANQHMTDCPSHSATFFCPSGKSVHCTAMFFTVTASSHEHLRGMTLRQNRLLSTPGLYFDITWHLTVVRYLCLSIIFVVAVKAVSQYICGNQNPMFSAFNLQK